MAFYAAVSSGLLSVWVIVLFQQPKHTWFPNQTNQKSHFRSDSGWCVALFLLVQKTDRFLLTNQIHRIPCIWAIFFFFYFLTKVCLNRNNSKESLSFWFRLIGRFISDRVASTENKSLPSDQSDARIPDAWVIVGISWESVCSNSCIFDRFFVLLLLFILIHLIRCSLESQNEMNPKRIERVTFALIHANMRISAHSGCFYLSRIFMQLCTYSVFLHSAPQRPGYWFPLATGS